MPGYVKAALLKFQRGATTKPQNALHRWNQPTYGAKNQYSDTNKADLVDAKSKLYVQQVCGNFLYYSIAVNQTMLSDLNAISAAQANATTTTMEDIVWLLNYVATHPDATIHYHASDMILHIARNASYLCEEQARSQAGGHFFLANRLVDNGDKPPTLPTKNGAIHTLCQIIKTVMSSAAEAEIGATFLNSKDDLSIRTTLKELGHPQPPTPVQVDYTTSVGFVSNTIKQKMSKAIDMRFYWIRDCTRQGQFKNYWGPGSTNLGDYHTKHHSPIHHILIRPQLLHEEPHVQLASLVVMHIMRGCVNYRKMRAVRAEPDINTRRHSTSINPL